MIIICNHRYGIDLALMSCCHQDNYNTLKATAKLMQMPLSDVKDLVMMGRFIEAGYKCYFRKIDETITPLNNILIGVKQDAMQQNHGMNHNTLNKKQEKLTEAYNRVHRVKRKHALKYEQTRDRPKGE